MSRETFVWRDGKCVPKHLAAPLSAPRHYVIPDSMDAIKSMADGKMYESKSDYYASVKARGFEIVGNEKPTLRRAEPNEQRVNAIVDQVMRGELR